MPLTKLPAEPGRTTVPPRVPPNAPSGRPEPATPPPSQRRRARIQRFIRRYRFMVAGLCTIAAVLLILPGLHTADPEGTATLVLTDDTPAGTALRADDVELRHLPHGALPETVLTDHADVAGRALSLGLPAGAAVLPSMLVGPGLAEHAPPGRVVIAVPLANEASARLAEPGREVDLMVGPEHGSGPATIAARAALVLAHSEDPPSTGGGLLAPGGSEPGARHIFVAVTPDAATVLLGAGSWAPVHAVLPGR